ncbi:Mast/stem cell growth factor receptor kita [Oryzias melastigma]|uniref:Mast/stem cell growth factor receptor kita n=1 Tax=Oryzias melastigma TaxID=30732 RepID=A0A834FKZ6_ORYME|nr:Mast/stem cell growth factor receptor kita [Oryzias melastigma]
MSMLFLSAVSCACVFYLGFSAEACTPAVLAKRGSVFMSEGNTLSLSCTVQHCESTWAGKWKWEKSIDSNSSIVRDSPRHHLMEKTPKASEIQLLLEVQRVEPADMGAYRCSVQWADGSTELGHWTYVNITRVVPTQRKVLHRFLVWAGASLCLPVILGLARCLSSEVKPQPQHRMQVIYAKVDKNQPHEPPRPPPRRSHPQKGRPPAFQGEKSKQKTELVYADIYQDVKGTRQVVRAPTESTVYSSVRSY